MKILALFDRSPFDLTNGQNLRVYNYAKELSTRHSIDLVCYGEKNIQVSSGFFRSVVTLRPYREAACRKAGLQRIRSAFSLDEFVPRDVENVNKIARLLAENGYDVIWAGGLDMMVMVPRGNQVPVLLDDCDHSLLKNLRALKQLRTTKAWLSRLKRTVMTTLAERREFPRASRVLYVSESDAKMARRVSANQNTVVIENGVDATFFCRRSDEFDPDLIVFEGNMSFEPNVDAALYFCKEVLPLIRRKKSDVRFRIVGKDPAPAIRKLETEEGVEVTGFVDDVRPHLEAAAVFVCPMRLGTGIKNKILQAWAMSAAVVATPESVGGLCAKDGSNVLIGADRTALADAVLRVLSDGALRQELACEGRNNVVHNFSWERQAIRLEAVFEELASARVAVTV